MRGIRKECKKVEYVSFPGHPELDQWEFSLKGLKWPSYSDFVVQSDPKNNSRQSSIQEIETVETHNLQSSEGQLRKPTDVVEVEVIATSLPGRHNKVFARSDDLLALQAENQLELDHSGKAEVKSCLEEDLGPDFQVRKSKEHPNCSLVRPVNPEPPPDSPALLKCKMRRKEMDEIEHFLSREWGFEGLTAGLSGFMPGPSPERDAWISQYFRGVCRNHNFKEISLCLIQDVVRSAISSHFGMKTDKMNQALWNSKRSKPGSGSRVTLIKFEDGFVPPYILTIWVSARGP
jgi:hypothetical protein